MTTPTDAELSAMSLHERIIRWLDSDEGRTLTLVSANADFEGPSHIMEYSTITSGVKSVYGETRHAIMDIIEKECP